MKKPGFNCKSGSAWFDWQIAGANWRQRNATASRESAKGAAGDFAGATDFPSLGVSARYRAFMECAV